ncbi:MAG: hypothetical protein LBG58_01455 [Planctomycetaceae bacterium]|nr:hypothetical protein [Planctomycetaceae bacterium]
MIDYDFLNPSLHSIIKIIVQTITRRVAAGWLVLPFQGERMSITHKRKTIPIVGYCAISLENFCGYRHFFSILCHQRDYG